MDLALALYLLLFGVAIFAPLRWAVISYLLLSTIDFTSGNNGVGVLNALKGLAYPILLMWRCRLYGGHGKVVTAPIAWLLFTGWAGVASLWSIYPLSAAKMVGELAGSFLICMAFMRAAKGGYLDPRLALPVASGALLIGVIRTLFTTRVSEVERFSGFTTAQGYAALLVSLYALALTAKNVRPAVRAAVCLVIAFAVIFNGSRIWFLGILMATLMGILISEARAWVKIYSVAFLVLAATTVFALKDPIFRLVAEAAPTNRIAAALNDAYRGDTKSYGLGTYRGRRALYERAIESIRSSSVLQLTFGHGTSNGRVLRPENNDRQIGDPNRAVHDEWLRIFYEWGIVGIGLWLLFIGSILIYGIQGIRKEKKVGYARPLIAYLPAFLAGLSTENILAGAGHAENIGFVMLIAIASLAHRSAYNASPYSAMPLPQWRPALAGAGRTAGSFYSGSRPA